MRYISKQRHNAKGDLMRGTLGEPYAGKPPVRFDEGRRENAEGTGNCGLFNPLCPRPPTLLEAALAAVI